MLRYIKRIVQAVVVVAQRILVTIILVILYIGGFGATLFFIFVFKRSLLFRNYKNDRTLWKEAVGYDPDPDDSLRQA